MPPRKPAIALISDHELFRQIVAQRLDEQGQGPVVQLATLEELVTETAKQRVDIAIIDIEHESADALAVVRVLRAEHPGLHVILLASPLRQAADASVVIESTGVERAAAVMSLVPALRTGSEDKAPHKHWSRITARQRDVMRWLSVGLDNAAIGQRLRIGERAVKAHVSSLLDLFGLDNRTQLALLADRAGLRPPARR